MNDITKGIDLLLSEEMNSCYCVVKYLKRAIIAEAHVARYITFEVIKL